MPVSKKRKKSGKPVQHRAPVIPSAEEPAPSDAPVVEHDKSRGGKPKNAFLAQQPQRRASQRGR